jgi:hypothetical protein
MSGSRQWQIFVAPGEESDNLPIDSSPWHDERWVRIPKEHWNLILDFAATFDQHKAEELDECSWAADNNDLDCVQASTDELKSLILFMEDLAQKISGADPLVPNSTEEVPDALENEEHVQMLKAVITVFNESLRLEEPFRAWVD